MPEQTPSITSWMRLEPRSRDREMNASLQARIYDPLWMLARQWQLGEFQGEDNGSPVMARWQAEAARLSRCHVGAIAAKDQIEAPRYDGNRMPLETLVEREIIRSPMSQAGKPERLRLAVEAGQQFLRVLEQEALSRDYRSAFIRQYPFLLTSEQRAALDGDSQIFCNMMMSRVPDGRKLYAAFRSSNGSRMAFEPALQIAPGDVAEIQKAAQRWVQWFDSLFSEPQDDGQSWLADRMEYGVSVAARLGDREHILTAQEYFEGHLDWYAFDENAEVSLGASQDSPPAEILRTAIPAPISFRGMPARRFWEFEDAQVNFGSVDAGPTDLVRMLLVEFTMAYGNDWFVIPVELEVGSLYRARSLVVTDTFGVQTLVKPASALGAPHAEWRMFQHAHTRRSGINTPESNLLFVAPSLMKSLESSPVEEVLFLRDEMANLAWGVERLVENAAERPLSRLETYLDKKRKRDADVPSVPSPDRETLQYRLTTEVPDYWFPLMPVRMEQGLRLRRGAVLQTDGSRTFLSAQGRILESNADLSLFEEEVPREGIRVTRSYQFTRWIDGSSHLWIGRRKRVGRGEGSSGLQFDSVRNLSQNS